jgi:hypothetical protein
MHLLYAWNFSVHMFPYWSAFLLFSDDAIDFLRMMFSSCIFYCREYQDYTKESIVDRIEKDLEEAGKNIWERRFLPSAVDVEEPQLPVNKEKRELVEHIKRDSQKSREMQEKLDNLVRDRFKEFGEEKLLLVKTPEEEVVKGLPPMELKWLFGDKEVNVPGAASFQMAQGWKKWREEAKANLKKKLLEDVELGKKYVAQRQVIMLIVSFMVSCL